MAKGPEARLQKKIKGALEDNFEGSFWFIVHGGPYQAKGIPDIIGCINGKFIGIEVKIPGREKKLTVIQARIIKLINQAGGLAFMTTSVEQALKTIKEHFQ